MYKMGTLNSIKLVSLSALSHNVILCYPMEIQNILALLSLIWIANTYYEIPYGVHMAYPILASQIFRRSDLQGLFLVGFSIIVHDYCQCS